MPVIRQLDPHVADLIAAGEVVERPFPSGWSRRGPPRDLSCAAEVNSALRQGFCGAKTLVRRISGVRPAAPRGGE